MQFDTVAARLDPWPAILPPPAEVFLPALAGGRRDPRDPSGRREPAPGRGRAAAVLVVVYPDRDGEARTVLIERASYDGHHSGEVSFPGGKAEPGDPDLEATAIREAIEEVGLRPDDAGLRLLGRLDDTWIPASDFRVTPVVALTASAPVLAPDPTEVTRILLPPIARFLPAPDVAVIERMIGEWHLRYGHFEVDGLSVWGATARILSQLGALLSPDR